MSKPLILKYPDALDIDHSDVLLRLYELATQNRKVDIIFDLSETEKIFPFGIILVTCTIQECLFRRQKCSYVPPISKTTKGFLSKMGFNKFFALPDSSESESVPTMKLEHKNLQLAWRLNLDPVLIDHLVEVFRYHLNLSQGIRGSLKLSFNETITNVMDHSESKIGYYVCAQSYPEENQLIVCITDPGIGILSSLKKSPLYSRLRNDCSAIEKSVEEGVSSRDSAAGLGLNHILKFAKVNEGKVYIVSGLGKVMWDFRGGHARLLKTKNKQSFQGTIINIIINIYKEGLYSLTAEESPIFD